MANLSLQHIYKIYPGDVTAVKDFNLEIEDKEFIVFVGPSGCGKSTTLRMIAGLEDISKGELYIGDKLVNDVEPKERDIAMVFQNYALYPHMTVYDNMAFSLSMIILQKEGKAYVFVFHPSSNTVHRQEVSILRLLNSNLLFHVQVGNTGNPLDGTLDFIAQSEHAVHVYIRTGFISLPALR